MARKHAKQFKQKQPVTRVVVKEAVHSKEREVTEVPEGTEGCMAITQDDGTTKYFIVQFKTITPAVVKHIACGPTTTRGKRNDGKSMAPKGLKLSKSVPTTGGKK